MVTSPGAATERWHGLPRDALPAPGLGDEGPFPTETGELPSDTERDEWRFLVSLDAFLVETTGQRLNSNAFRLPSPYGVTLNLVKLYRAVCIRGGYAQCTECKQWRRVAHEFELPVTATAASHQFRNFYVKFCLDYENRYFTGQVQPGTAPRASGGSDSDVSLPAMGHTGASRLHKRSASDAAFTAASAQPPKRAATQSPPPFAAEAAALPGSLAPVAQAAAMLNLLTPSEGPYLVLPAHFEGVQLPRIKQALGSGVASEAAWSLNALLVASCDARSELRLATLPGLAQALLSLITRTMTSRIYLQLPPGSQGAAAAVQALPRRCGPSCRPQDYEAADEARATRAIAPAMRERVLSDPMEGAEREEAMAACAAALVLRNCSFNPFNAAMMATPDAASAALVFLRCELAASSMVFEAVPGEGPLESLVDYFCEPCFPERAACASDLLQLLLHAAPHVSLIHGQQSSALTLNSFGRVCLGALSIPPSAWPLWPQRAAAGAELLSLLATNANASAFMPKAVLGTPHTIIPPLLNLLTDEAHEPNAAAAAALVRLAEMRNAKHRAYLAAVPGIVDTLLCTIRRPGASSSVQRHCAAMLAALASSMSEATPQLMARAPELIQLAVGDGPVAFHASRALKATVTRDIVLGPPELRRRP